MVIGWNLSSSGLELVADHGCGVAVELGRGSDCDEGDVVEVRLVPEFEGWRLLGVYALCVCVDSSGCAVGLMVGDGF